MERDLWMAGQMNESRKLPVEPDTVLFIEDFSTGAAGVVSNLFMEALKDPAYSHCRLVWTARDYDSTLDQFGELIEDDRVWIVMRGMADFIKALAVAGRIYCANTLPNYYIKREGQTIYTSFQLYIFTSDCYTKNQIKNAVKTLNDTDYFLCADDGYDDAVLVKDLGISRDRISYYPLPAETTDRNKIIISINREPHLTRNCSSFAGFVKRIEALAGFYGKTVCSFTGLSFWKKYRKQKDYFGIENVFCDEQNLTRFYGDACLLITDSYLRALQAQRCHIPVILCADKEMPEMLDGFFEDLTVATQYSTIYREMERLFGGLGVEGELLYSEEDADEKAGKDDPIFGKPERHDVESDYADESGEDNDDEETAVSAERICSRKDRSSADFFCRREVAPAENRESYLYLFKWEKSASYAETVERWLEKTDDGKKDITLMFLSSGSSALYDDIQRFHLPHRITCRVGYYQSSQEERKMIKEKSGDLDDYLENSSHAFIADEWKRLLGNVHFDHIIADKTSIFFWKTMYKYPPTDDFVILESEDKKNLLNEK